MSSNGSEGIPEISDDDLMDNDLQELYAKEIKEGFFPSSQMSQAKTGAPSTAREDDNDSEKVIPYNSWKSSNKQLLDSVSFPSSPKEQSMRSKLGKSLAAAHQIVDNTLTPENATPPLRRQKKSLPSPQNNTSGERKKAIYSPFNGSPMTDSGFDPRAENYPFNQYYQPPPMFQGKFYNPNMNAYCHPNASQDMFMSTPPRGGFPEQERDHGKDSMRHPYNYNPYFNHNMNGSFPEYPNAVPRNDMNTSASKDCNCQQKSSDSPIYKKLNKQIQAKNKKIAELFRIAWLQNQQLGLLQKQVQLLIESNAQNERDIKNLFKSSPCDSPKRKAKVGKERSPNLPVIVESPKTEEKVSVGIMTSFIETGFKRVLPSPNCGCNCKTNTEQQFTNQANETSDDSSSSEPKPQMKSKKSDKRSHARAPADESLTLNGIVIPTVVEQGTSPDSSMNLDLQEYKSSSSDSSDSESSSDSSDEEVFRPKEKWDHLNAMQAGPSRDDILVAAQEQAKKLGLNTKDIEGAASKRVTFSNFSAFPTNSHQRQLHADSDTSMRMNLLAQKYLKEELTQGVTDKMQDLAICNVVNGGTNLSFATMRYLERYQLIPSGNGPNPQIEPSKSHRKSKKKTSSPKDKRSSKKEKREKYPNGMNNILDVTAIRKQSKLLPK